jgi:S-DNA-T family DNA segregation ATPase FtsK/SpoIIIE
MLGWVTRAFVKQVAGRLSGLAVATLGALLAVSLITFHPGDPSLDASSAAHPANLLGALGAAVADLGLQSLGLAAGGIALLAGVAGVAAMVGRPAAPARRSGLRLGAAAVGVVALAAALAAPAPPATWPLSAGLGGMVGDTLLDLFARPLATGPGEPTRWILGAACALGAGLGIAYGLGIGAGRRAAARPAAGIRPGAGPHGATDEAGRPVKSPKTPQARSSSGGLAATGGGAASGDALGAATTGGVGSAAGVEPAEAAPVFGTALAIKPPKAVARSSGREARELQPTLPFGEPGFRLPELIMLTKPKPRASAYDEDALRRNAQLLETVLGEFGVRGQIDQIRPGPVVTLYELVPAAGVKGARVVALSDDIARSMSVAACRVSIVPGRNAIGIELPNGRRETVYLRDLLASAEYEKASQNLPLALGETIGGEPYIADLAKMPHLLIAGTTGSGKSVGVNAMILSILYRLPPEKCRFIMIDPKMLELSIYDGIPHLLAPVVTDPKKAIVALKWSVREMEDRYRRMSKIGVRNVAGYNERANEALARGEHFVRTVQTGFDEAGRPVYEEEKLRPEPMPFLVVVIDEVADLMMVAGKDIEGAVQRLAQMARAAGIHLIMATQRPSVDVITGTIKANFPTRISFQVTSKIDSRTIMGEQGAEQLLGMGDMLYMAGGGRITRLHGPYVDDEEVIKVATFLREQGEPQYLEDVTALPDTDEEGAAGGSEESGGGHELYDQAVAVVTRDRKASTSYIQRRLQIGYNRAASLIERMEQEGVVGAANHAGKREVLVQPPP